jgi:hypothetical protein
MMLARPTTTIVVEKSPPTQLPRADILTTGCTLVAGFAVMLLAIAGLFYFKRLQRGKRSSMKEAGEEDSEERMHEQKDSRCPTPVQSSFVDAETVVMNSALLDCGAISMHPKHVGPDCFVDETDGSGVFKSNRELHNVTVTEETDEATTVTDDGGDVLPHQPNNAAYVSRAPCGPSFLSSERPGFGPPPLFSSCGKENDKPCTVYITDINAIREPTKDNDPMKPAQTLNSAIFSPAGYTI